MLNQHQVVVTTGKDVSIYLKQITGLLESSKELAVFIQNDCVAKPKLQLDFHNSQSKDLGGGMTWFHPVWDTFLRKSTKNIFFSVHKHSTLKARLII
jgi:hypothetical protein